MQPVTQDCIDLYSPSSISTSLISHSLEIPSHIAQVPAPFMVITAITPMLFQLMFLSNSSSGLNSQKIILESNDFLTLWDFAPLIIRFLISCDQMLLFSHTYLCVLHIDCSLCCQAQIYISLFIYSSLVFHHNH